MLEIKQMVDYFWCLLSNKSPRNVHRAGLSDPFLVAVSKRSCCKKTISNIYGADKILFNPTNL